MKKQQQGFVHFNIWPLILFAAVVGAAIALAIIYGGPALWECVKPWLHKVTA